VKRIKKIVPKRESEKKLKESPDLLRSSKKKGDQRPKSTKPPRNKNKRDCKGGKESLEEN